MKGKRGKLILISLLAGFALFFSAAAILCTVYADDIRLRQAEKLMDAGEYLFAAEIYQRLGDGENAALCEKMHVEQRYINSSRDLQIGNYPEAMEGLSTLGGYKSSSRLMEACRYLWAGELMAAGDYLEARRLYLELEEYPGLDAALESCNEHIYQQALELARDFELEEASLLWRELGDYKDCARLISRAETMLNWLEGDGRILESGGLYPNSYYENVYVNELAYVVVPEECSRDCRFFLYYPGGKDEEINIDFLLYYLMNPAPDTIAVFLRTNGLYDMRAKNQAALELLVNTAAECGVFPTEIVSAGSSLGAYPAMHSAVYSPADMGIGVSCVLSLDAGDDWNSTHVLSRSRCLEAAESGTRFYLFESPWVGTDRAAIRTMVETGNDVILVGCEYDEHVRITLDAMGMGVIHWALGDRTQPCELDIYTFTKLYV